MHFSVLTVISPERFNKDIEAIRAEYTEVVENQDLSVLGREKDRQIVESLIKVRDYDAHAVEDIYQYMAINKSIADLLSPYQEGPTGDCAAEYPAFYDITDEVREDVDRLIKIKPEDYLGKKYSGAAGETVGDFYRICFENDGSGDLGISKEQIIEYLEKKGAPSQIMTNFQYENSHIAVIKDLDIDKFEQATQKKIDAFWEKYQKYMETGTDPEDSPLYGVHYELIQMGIEVLNQDTVYEAHDINRKIQHARQAIELLTMSKEDQEKLSFFKKRYLKKYVRDSRNFDNLETYLENLRAVSEQELVGVPAYKYARTLTKQDLMGEFRWRFNFFTHAVVDDEGWHAKDMCSGNADDRAEWCKSFHKKFIRSRDPDTIIAVLDCHI